jgi:hypothetical protein
LNGSDIDAALGRRPAESASTVFGRTADRTAVALVADNDHMYRRIAWIG